MLQENQKTIISRSVRNTGLILLIICVTASGLYAQRSRPEPPPLKERLFYGGSFGLQFGSITDIQIAPVIGIWVLPRLAVAAGPNYRFL